MCSSSKSKNQELFNTIIFAFAGLALVSLVLVDRRMNNFVQEVVFVDKVLHTVVGLLLSGFLINLSSYFFYHKSKLMEIVIFILAVSLLWEWWESMKAWEGWLEAILDTIFAIAGGVVYKIVLDYQDDT